MAEVTVKVHLPSLLEQAAGGRRELELRAATLDGLLEALTTAHPLLRGHLFDDSGAIRRHVHLFYNDRELRWLDDWSVPLREGDSLTVLQAVSGG